MFMPQDHLPRVFSEIARVLRPGGRLHAWDFAYKMPPNVDRSALGFFLTVTLPDGRNIETGFGCRARDQDMDDFIRLAEREGLQAKTAEREGLTFHVVFMKPG
jgi:ubiquinone/menaquinone biosynthesis C-methylase UbiE